MKRNIKILALILLICTIIFGCGGLSGLTAKHASKNLLSKTVVKLVSDGVSVGSKVFKATKHYVDCGYNTLREALNSMSNKLTVIRYKRSMSSAIVKTATYKELIEIEQKGAIKLSKKELDDLLSNPTDYFRGYIKAYTGDSKQFQEFFIRLANGDKDQLKTILSDPKIKDMVEKRIRSSSGGGNHEWLMAKNYLDFLSNPKWGNDGNFLSLAMTKLVQRTEEVVFKYGGSHGSTNSTMFHNKLAKLIASCNTKEELFISIKNFARAELSAESYIKFKGIMSEILKSA